jgi:hypothetical protein
MSDKPTGTCQVCGEVKTLTANGRIRSHGPVKNRCGGGSDFPASPALLPMRLADESDHEFHQRIAEWALEFPDDDPRPTAGEAQWAENLAGGGFSGQEVDEAELTRAAARQFGVRPDAASGDGRTPEQAAMIEQRRADPDGVLARAAQMSPQVAAMLPRATDLAAKVAADKASVQEQALAALARRTPEQKLATAKRMDATASAATGLPQDAFLQAYDPKCPACNTDDHRCKGCGDPVPHPGAPCGMCRVEHAAGVPATKGVPVSGTDRTFRNHLSPHNLDRSGGTAVQSPDDAAAAFLGGGGAVGSDADAAAFLAGGDSGEDSGGIGPWFASRYDGDCDNPECGQHFDAGEDIRGREYGYQGRECCGDDEDADGRDGAAPRPAKKVRPRRVSVKPPLENGRYALPHPQTGAKWSAMRVTNFCEKAAETYNLTRWELRSAITGLALNPERMADVLAQIDTADVGGSIKKNRVPLDRLVEQLKNLAGAKDKAGIGTKLHKWTEQVDAGTMQVADVPADFRDLVARYRDILEAAGYTPVPHLMERTTGIPRINVVGTFDLVVRCADGKYRMTDKKSGSVQWAHKEMCVQLATYVEGFNSVGIAQWNGEGDATDWGNWTWVVPTGLDGEPIKVETDYAIILNIPQGGGEVIPFEANLETGRMGMAACETQLAWGRTHPTLTPVSVPVQENRPPREDPDPRDVPHAPRADGGDPRDLFPVIEAAKAAGAPPVGAKVTVAGTTFTKVSEDPWPGLRDKFAAVTTKEQASALYQRAQTDGVAPDHLAEYVAVAKEALARAGQAAVRRMHDAAHASAGIPTPEQNEAAAVLGTMQAHEAVIDAREAAEFTQGMFETLTWPVLRNAFATVTTKEQASALYLQAKADGVAQKYLDEGVAAATAALAKAAAPKAEPVHDWAADLRAVTTREQANAVFLRARETHLSPEVLEHLVTVGRETLVKASLRQRFAAVRTRDEANTLYREATASVDEATLAELLEVGRTALAGH